MSYEMFDAKKLLGDTVYEVAKDRDDIVLLSTDSAPRSGFATFIEKKPEAYYELGIMEQAAIGVGAGMAVAGKTPVWCGPAPFCTARPFEFFKVDLGYMHQNMKVIGRNCGFNYADLGPTHYGLEDYGLVRMIPDVVILAPQDASELKGAIRAMLDYKGPVYLRLSTAKLPKLFEEKAFEIGKGNLIEDGGDVTILTTGEITVNTLAAVELLKAKGVSVRVAGLPTISPIDTDLIVESAKKTGRLVTVEEHFVVGGLGTIVEEITAENCPVPVKKIGVPLSYISAGPYGDMIKYCGLDPESICNTVLAFMEK